MLERTLFNGVIAGVSLSGDKFFYTNPLESDGHYAFNSGARSREPWFDCSCCPTNLARFIPAIPDYVYAIERDALFVNLFVASVATIELGGGPVTVAQTTLYPWDGAISIALHPDRPRAFELRIRIPGWARDRPLPSDLYRYSVDETASAATVSVNGQPVRSELTDGYASLRRTWSPGDVVTIDLPMPVRRVTADRRVADDRGKVALVRGPLVYCAEAPDHGGAALDLAVPDGARFTVESRPELLGGVRVLRGAVLDSAGRARELAAIPYYAWSNRGPGEMTVWFARP
jgi:DUF1680 family protein